MKLNRYIVYFFFLISLFSLACGDSTTTTPQNPINTITLLEGVVEYGGPYPAPAMITYTVNGVSHTVQGYPGQIIVVFKSSTKEEDAINIISSRSGTVIGKIPKTGFYLAKVTPGLEAAFISAISSNLSVVFAKPNIVPQYMSSDTVLVIDDCSGTHGNQVISTYSQNGGGYLVNCQSDDDGNHHPVAYISSSHVLLEAINNNGGNSFINISTSGPTEETWEELMRIYLYTLLELPANLRENLVITFCAGNENFDLTQALVNLRSDPLLAELLSKNVLIVGATEEVFSSSNDAQGDPDFACMESVEAPNGSLGTSFAAPRALAIIHILTEQFSISPKNALFIAKLSVASNSKGELIKTEAIDKATKWKAAMQHDPPGAYNITSINFTSIGSSTSAVISPVLSNVTVSYTVSGTDGYYDSGTEYTNSGGTVNFSIPPGAQGVVDLITVTAILSGKTKSTHYTWSTAVKQTRIK